MRVIIEPKVTVISKQIFIPHPDYPIPDDGTDAEKIGAFAAKCCYDSYGKEGRPNVENQRAIKEHAHGSVAEHAVVGVFIEGVTRGLSLELNRHRSFAISQRSTRYTKEEDSSIVLDPYYSRIWTKFGIRQLVDGGLVSDLGYDLQAQSTYDKNPELEMLVRFVSSCWSSITDYKKQVELLESINPNQLKGFDLRKWARGKARNVLPHALETRGTYTNNFRGYRWFLEARSDRHAEPEIRILAHHVLEAIRPIAPVYTDDFDVREIYDSIPEWKPQYRKI